MSAAVHFLAPLKGRPEAWLCRSDGTPVARQVETGFASASRTRGLLGRTTMPADAAMILAPTWAIHTFGMAFAIDVVFAGRDGTVVKLARHVVPRRLAAAWRAFAVIELAAGQIDRAGVVLGDRLQIMGPRSADG